MMSIDIADRLHRSVKMALDSGEAQSIEEAERIFGGYRLALEVGPEVAASPTLQAAVLTAVNTGRRCFLGGVEVAGDVGARLLVPWRSCSTFEEAILDLGGRPVSAPAVGVPSVAFGTAQGSAAPDGFAVQATFDGWSGGVVPLRGGRRLAEEHEFVPAGVLSGALAVSEAFQHVRGGHAVVGRRQVGLSLWRPGADPWHVSTAAGPPLELLPSRLWIIGLGHLGQAFLWTLGLLPYARPDEVKLVLQDFDILSEANLSTSPLTFAHLLGQRKTRAMATWCEARGFRTAIYERRFGLDFKVIGEEPSLALCGVDNALARAALEEVGFERVIEAGLGAGSSEYLAFQMHTFPGPQRARERWGTSGDATGDNASETLIDRPAYRALLGKGADRCGLVTLADRTVGASFVGAAVSALVIGEVLRLLAGGSSCGLIDGSLRSPTDVRVIAGDSQPYNPGFTLADEGEWNAAAV